MTGGQLGIMHRQHAHQGPHPVDFDRADPPGPGRRARSSSPPASRGSTRTTTSPPWAAAAATPRPWPWPPSLHADACEIYTDVDGVYTTDPRVVPEARRVKQISYDEMLELASAGAGVMHNRSIEFAKKFAVPIHVRSSFSDQSGHDDRRRARSRPTRPVCGAALVKDEARVTVLGVPDRPGHGAGDLLEDRRQEHRHRHDRAERGRRRDWPTFPSP